MQPVATDDGKDRNSGSADQITLIDPDPAWPDQYAAEMDLLLTVLPQGPEIRLEHFGSTAIAGIRAKPVIDIMVIHPAPVDWPGLIEPFSTLGYEYWSGNPRKDRMFFVKGRPPAGRRRTHHLHVRIPTDAEAELSFRDRLRASPTLARRYEALKEALARRFPDDREAYTEAKTDFVAEVLGRLLP